MVYEDIIFMQGDEAQEALDILDSKGEISAIEHLKQWQDPGNHQQSPGLGNGTQDTVFEFCNYFLVYNTGVGYIGLSFKIEGES